MLTQRALAEYLLGRGAEYLFTVKGNQPNLHDDIRLLLDQSIAWGAPDFTVETAKPEHGRRERRSIWASSELNGYLNFPGVGQVFAVRRDIVEVKSGKRRTETATGSPAWTHRAYPRNASSPSIADTGRSRQCTTSSTGASMRIVAASAPDTARRT